VITINSFISWVGGKKALRDQIYQRFPLEFTRYVEVFGGGGWVLFGRTPDSSLEVYNDFNKDLVNLFRCVKSRTLAFLKELNFLPLNSRDDFEVLKRFLRKEDFSDAYLQEELDLAMLYLKPAEFAEIKPILLENAEAVDVRRAAAFYKLIRYSYGSGGTSFGCQPFDIRKTFYSMWAASRRLKDVLIENRDFEALIRLYDKQDAFFYCDPPYYETEDHYQVKFKKEDHVRLRDTLAHIQGHFLLSYNDCDYIRDLYKDCHIEAVTRLNNLAQRYDGGAEFAELFIANYDMTDRMRSLPMQIGLFDGQNGLSVADGGWGIF
jgi:DNA adenine methylase